MIGRWFRSQIMTCQLPAGKHMMTSAEVRSHPDRTVVYYRACGCYEVLPPKKVRKNVPEVVDKWLSTR